MKWLFATLVALNIIVFASMVGYKLLVKHMPQPAQPVVSAPTQAPPQVIINTGTTTAVPNATPSNNNSSSSNNITTRANAPKTIGPATNTTKSAPKTDRNSSNETARAQYKACSARVSMPEDDYHRIKGLLGRFPHAATRQVVENTGEEGTQSTSRMNILFMSVNDQDAGAIQGIVGRYGQLNRAACNQ